MAKAPSAAGNRTITHPIYTAWQKTWIKALDVYEGAGGFLDERRPYLFAHPREYLDHSIKNSDGSWSPNPSPIKPSPKLQMRWKLARYENVAETVVDSVDGALFMFQPTRTFGKGSGTQNDAIAQWWENVDGRKNSMDTFLHDAWLVAAVFGHAILLAEKDNDVEGETAADAKAPRLCRYTPLDMIDWLTDDDGNLTAVKLLEPAPRTTFDQVGFLGDASSLTNQTYRVQIRVVDDKEWTLYSSSGRKIDGGLHGFGRLPVEILYGKRRPLTPIIGKSIMGDPALYVDLYNLTSEIRELLRNQTFGVLNVPVGKDGNVSAEQEMLGQQSGTSNVLFSSNPAQYLSPSADNVTVYHEHNDRLTRMIYRLAQLPWEGDSRVAESADSRRIKREAMNQVLLKYAAELQRADDTMLELAYRALYGDSWEKQKESDQVTVSYPSSFEPPDLELIAAQAAEAMGLDLGPTATKEIKKRFVRVMVPDLAPELQQKSDTEIEGQIILTAQEQQQNLLDAAASRMTKPGAPGQPGGKNLPPTPKAAVPPQGAAA